MGSIRVPLHVTEKNGTLSAGADNLVFSLTYDMSQPARLIPGGNSDTLISGYPIAIYAYEFRCLGDFYGQIYQTYGDTDDATNLTDWNLANDEFVLGLKQSRQLAGTGSSLDKTVIRYSAKKNPKKLQGRYGKWKRPPIFLGPGAGNGFYCMVHNNSDSENRTFLAHLKISSWKQFT